MKVLVEKFIFILIPTIAFILVITAVIVFTYWFAYELNKPISNLLEDWAHFGDFLGGTIGSILTFLTLLTVVLTLYYQREELSNTRQELRESMRIAALQEEALRSQANAQNKSVFESAFMQMTEIHFRLIDSYKIGNKDGSQNFAENILRLIKVLKENSEYDFRGIMDSRMHRHLFHFAAIVDLIVNNSMLSDSDQEYYIRVLQNIIGDNVIEFIRLAYSLQYFNNIRGQLLRLCSDVA
ncbi:hypothetical protein [Leptospira stimsonii]|uniref:Phage abortive infection protein n=1 Tax=Leptospira stimsonii TaxID=2202203 RepID=A0ABY2NEN0_9LEPT|nr:hypothetical protein [Leptospira stimsonii]TGK18386.1 hypothetical protein EHO98_13320 [Leptospira stimsonii]TGM22497.1 hypothetical protein EHQ90_00905 [Leptospira stimsonii]